MLKACLYCNLQFANTTRFCPNCGRPTESGFKFRPLQEVEWDHHREQVKEKDELVQQLVLRQTQGTCKNCP